MSDIKTIINQGNLDGLTWDQLNAKKDARIAELEQTIRDMSEE